jgi:hypothetical protein
MILKVVIKLLLAIYLTLNLIEVIMVRIDEELDE